MNAVAYPNDPLKTHWLRSVIMMNVWQPGVPMEGDTRTQYGVHAFKTLDLALEYGTENRFHGYMWSGFGYVGDGFPKYELICGSVALWGEIVEHARGYRASLAKVTGLDRFIKPSSEAVDIDQLRLKYHV